MTQRFPPVPHEARRVDYALRRLARMRHQITLPLARAAAAVVRTRAWVDLGYVNEHRFAREFVDTSAKTLRNLAALEVFLQRFPVLVRAVAGTDESPPIGRCVALRIGKVATPETIGTWIDRARRLSVRDLDALIRDASSAVNGDGVPTIQPSERAKGRVRTPTDKHPDTQVPEKTSNRTGSDDDGRADPDVLFRIQLPPEARMALDEVTDLHRATAGHDATRTCFLEDFLAEVAASGVWAPDLDRTPTGRFRPVRRGTRAGPRAPIARQDHDVWPTHSTEGRLATRLLESFAHDLRDLARITASADGAPGGRILQKRAVARILRRLLGQENQIELRMGGLLLEQHERRAWAVWGCASLEEYAERLGWNGTSARRRVDVARALRRLAVVQRAYESGRVTLARTRWIVRSIQRVRLTEHEQQRWVEHAAPLQNKRLQEESRILERNRLEHRAAVARAVTLQHTAGAQAADSITGDSNTTDLNTTDAKARGSNSGNSNGGAKTSVEQCFPVPPDDGTWLGSISRVPGQTRDRLLDLEGALLERVLMRGAMLEERVAFSIPESLADDFHACLMQLCRRLRREVVEPRSAAEEARTLLPVRIAAAYLDRGAHVPLWVGLLAAFEICVLEWDEPRRRGASRPLQRQVLERDGYRCTAPGCTARRNLQVNHIHERSRGGPDALWNLHTVCAAHHLQFIHGGRASVRGRAPGKLLWRIGRPEMAQWFVNERRIRSMI